MEQLYLQSITTTTQTTKPKQTKKRTSAEHYVLYAEQRAPLPIKVYFVLDALFTAHEQNELLDLDDIAHAAWEWSAIYGDVGIDDGAIRRQVTLAQRAIRLVSPYQHIIPVKVDDPRWKHKYKFDPVGSRTYSE